MIHVFIGTKAQYIKMAPLLRRMDAEGVDYRLIDSGQHGGLTESLRRELRVGTPTAAWVRTATSSQCPRPSDGHWGCHDTSCLGRGSATVCSGAAAACAWCTATRRPRC